MNILPCSLLEQYSVIGMSGLVKVGDPSDVNFATALIICVAMILQATVFITCVYCLIRMWG